ncbi:helix-turn-helix domain-containing protein [Sphingobacterium faecale]|uniref:Helix-turn-helix transcriptional regulator n=1 Tax=Sphingobacterium faecale TaxID=2803775 RepID=A0ABS1QYU6_9SPHI|nr:helix-turn-helix transcriptional regulator [Sphingobacterium faecale]MBL1407592.1 helix-turn-helix transcriptional regulator [Sphingobacterium faecale]
MKFFVFLFVVFLSIVHSSYAFSKDFDPTALATEIADFNDKQEFEKAILKLEAILDNKNSTSYERYNAYLQKSLIYKRLYNYTGALKNLDLAIMEPVADKFREQVDFRVQVERLFVYFDLQQQKEVDRIFGSIDQSKLNLLPAETQSFFICLLAIRSMKSKDYLAANTQLDQAIEIQKADNPKNLPSIYRIKVALFQEMGNHNAALKAYEEGMLYANQYNMAIYRIIMEETITRYYEHIKDYRNALYSQKRVSIARTNYDANNQVGKLNLIENDLLQERKDLEIKSERYLKYYLISFTSVLLLLLILLYLLYRSNKQKRVLVELDNERMRVTLQQLTSKSEDVQKDSATLGNFSFTSRQQEIIDLVNQGKTNKEIGLVLFISENTVKYHLKAIYEILGIDRRSALKASFSSTPKVD